MGTRFQIDHICNGDKVSNRLYFAMGTRFQDCILQWTIFILQWGQGFKKTIFCNGDKVSNRLYFVIGTRFQTDYILQWGQCFK